MKEQDQKPAPTEAPAIEDHGAMDRFNISSHLRGAEAEIDTMHRKWLASIQERKELLQQLVKAKKTIEELNAQVESLKGGGKKPVNKG